MKKGILSLCIVLSFALLQCACNTTDKPSISSGIAEYAASGTQDSLVTSPEQSKVAATRLEAIQSISFPADLGEEKNAYALSAYWVDDSTAFGVDNNNNEIKIYVVNTKNAEITKLNTSLPDEQIREARVISDRLLISTRSGFYSVDLSGNVEEVFIFEKEKDRYTLPIEYLTSDPAMYIPANFPIISDDLHYISYSFYQTGERGAEDLPGGEWEMVLLDLQSKTKTTLISKIWEPCSADDIVSFMHPVAFSLDNRYLLYNSAHPFMEPWSEFGGRIDLATNEMTAGEGEHLFLFQKVIDNEKALIFEQGPPDPGKVWSIHIYNYATDKFSICQQVDFSADLLQNNGLFYYRYSDKMLIINDRIEEYAELPISQSGTLDFNFTEISQDGRLIGFNFNEDGDYEFVIYDLYEYK